MYRPLGFRGEVFIRTRFGVLSAEPEAWGTSIDELLLSPIWTNLIGLIDGPYCMTDDEREVPF